MTLLSPVLSEDVTPKRPPWAILLPLCGLLFLIGTETYLVSPILPTVAKDLHVTINTAALVVTTYVLVYALIAPWAGGISDQVGRPLFILIGGSIFILSNLLASLTTNIGILMFARGLTGLGAAAAGPAIWALIGDLTHPSIRGRVMSIGMAFFSLGQVLGVPIGTFVAAWLGWHWAFAFLGFVCLLLLPVLLFHFRAALLEKRKRTVRFDSLYAVLNIWRTPTLVFALAITFFWAAANLGSYTYIGALLQTRYGLTLKQVGLIGLVVGGGSLCGSLIGGRLSDFFRKRHGREELLVGFWALFLGIATVGATTTPVLWISFLCLALWFVASGAFVTCQQTLLSLLVPERRGTALSWNNSIMYAGTAVGTWFIGMFFGQGIEIGWIALGLSIIAVGPALLLTKLNHD